MNNDWIKPEWCINPNPCSICLCYDFENRVCEITKIEVIKEPKGQQSEVL